GPGRSRRRAPARRAAPGARSAARTFFAWGRTQQIREAGAAAGRPRGRSVAAGIDDLAAVAGRELLEDRQRRPVGQEPDGAVTEAKVGPLGVVGAVGGEAEVLVDEAGVGLEVGRHHPVDRLGGAEAVVEAGQGVGPGPAAAVAERLLVDALVGR